MNNHIYFQDAAGHWIRRNINVGKDTPVIKPTAINAGSPEYWADRREAWGRIIELERAEKAVRTAPMYYSNGIDGDPIENIEPFDRVTDAAWAVLGCNTARSILRRNKRNLPESFHLDMRSVDPLDVMEVLARDHSQSLAVPLFDAIMRHAASCTNDPYQTAFEVWLGGGHTTILRDELITPFLDAKFIKCDNPPKHPMFEAWTTIDAAMHTLMSKIDGFAA